MQNFGNPFRDDGWQTRRPNVANPKDPKCQLHLQRICGTCKHFEGPMKPVTNHPHARPTARCSYFQIEKQRHAKAGNCRRWEREHKEVQA